MLQVRDLTFDYADQSLLQGLNFEVGAGCLLHIKGQNGAGKTTLLKLLAGLLQPVLGEINTQVGCTYLGHKNGVNTHLTPKEHLMYDLGVTSRREQEKLLTAFSLVRVQNKPCFMLSAGQKRRVGLFKLMTQKAKLWLLDEPLVGLDAESIAVFGELIINHLTASGSVILTSHQVLPFDLKPVVLKELVL